MYKEHPVFEKPENGNAKIWRYIDFTKFVCLLDKSALFFSRADRLGDQFEGSYSRANVRLRPEVYKDIPPDVLENISKFCRIFVKHTAINCWHLSDYESVAMWNLYRKSADGIAIQSTFDLLKTSLKDETHNVHIGKVRYIDFEKDWMPEGNTLYPFVHKRRSFEHEKELRAVIQELLYKKNGEIDWSRPSFDDGIYVQVDLDVLIDKIYLAPTSPKWLLELIRSITEKYDLDKDVLPSSLDDAPVY
jgi:hypothetical protein